MPLSMVEQGDTRTITEFRGQEEMKRRLQDLGFIKGEKIHGLANRIMVAEHDS